jgi:hypothetical protein
VKFETALGVLVASALFTAAMAAAEPGSPAEAELREAVQEKPVPCAVAAHGIEAVVDGVRGNSPSRQCDNSVDLSRIDIDSLISILPEQHPAYYFAAAGRLFQADRQKDAVFWFYAGQLRSRVRLKCHPELPPGGEPALFGALQATIGETIRDYSSADPDAWAAAMKHALDWDARTPNGFEPKTPCALAIAEQRKALADLRQYVLDHKAEIKAQRARDGLE